MANLKKVLIMAGGTGGHVFPGLAVAQRLREEGIEVHWLGTQKGLEAKLVPEAGIPIHYISISGIRGKGWKDLALAPWRLTGAIMQSIKVLRQLRPDVVIGMGGFVSGPGGIACGLLRIPLVIHEQNAKPGTTNKWLASIAKKVLEGFPNTFVQRQKVVTIGNPVRIQIIKLPQPTERFANRENPLRLLIVGGSLGAAAINRLVPQALAKMPLAERPIVLHQTGEKHFAETQKAYTDAGVSADIKPFIVEMDKAYEWADIVLCRSGALTVAELCAAGVGAILVPFPFAIDDHQTANANFMVKEEAAYLIQQADLTTDNLVSLLKQLYADRKKCVAMAQSAYKLRKIDATDEVLRICQEICQ
jgi:UDP-N-acetylglucosamine--N-acetylmuramyl-(pentapeptide) pyrophosphoryl-undecaprenol N-acetylglucosamine transferase